MANPTLITLDDVKAKFPRWETFCESDSDYADTEAVLLECVLSAETELLEYVPDVGAAIGDPLTRHLMVIIRKNAFDHLHGQETFEQKPQVIRDYEHTLKMLERYKAGEFAAPVAGDDDAEPSVSIEAKARRFDTWFTGD